MLSLEGFILHFEFFKKWHLEKTDHFKTNSTALKHLGGGAFIKLLFHPGLSTWLIGLLQWIDYSRMLRQCDVSPPYAKQTYPLTFSRTVSSSSQCQLPPWESTLLPLYVGRLEACMFLMEQTVVFFLLFFFSALRLYLCLKCLWDLRELIYKISILQGSVLELYFIYFILS